MLLHIQRRRARSGGRLDGVADRNGAARGALVGRAGEIDAVNGLLRAAARGDAGALLISGEAGVGKTALAREVTTRTNDDADVLWAPCLPLTSLAVPFLPLATALRSWAASRDVPMPAIGGSGDEGPASFDVWLDEVCRQRPVVLVVDDLQWADQSSLDVLMYVLAGLAGRRLAVLTTVRAGEESGSLRRWLADVRRFPGVSELTLGRLDRVATGEQIAALLGGPPHQSLIDEVYARTHGNAYLTKLLVRGLSPNARSLPAGLPTDLREAAARAWHGLSTQTRELTRLIAVAGRPQRAGDIDKIAVTTGIGSDIVPLLREAVDAGVLEVRTDETYWFVHPLLAEVLEHGLLPEERRTFHAVLAHTLESAGDPARLSVEAAVDTADHHYRAGHQQDAYRWALLAADAAGQAGGATEKLRLLRRALALWPDAPDPGISRLDLLRRIQAAANEAGDEDDEIAAIEEMLASIDTAGEPLLAAELLVRRMLLRTSTGREFNGLADVRQAVRLSADYPDSPEHALAMAELAHAELWHSVPSGPAHAEEAVRRARACESPRALAFALTAHVMKQIIADEPGGLPDAEEAQAAAAEARDFFAFSHATRWAGNCIDVCVANRDVLERYRQGREKLIALGAPYLYIAGLSASEATGLLQLGDWRTCEERLRDALASTPGAWADVTARLTAALLSCRQGRMADAEAHLDRAEEVFAVQSEALAFEFDAVRAELSVAAGDTERAFSAALIGVSVEGEYPTLVERLIPLAARAAADQVQAACDRGEDATPALARLQDLRRRFPRVVAETTHLGPSYIAQVRAMQAWYDAEVLRGPDDPRAATAWQHAAQACADAELAWDEAYACWRAAESLFNDRHRRGEAAAALRRAHELATDLQAAPILAEVEALANSARVSLAAPEAGPEQAPRLPGLTAREREILAYITAGRTYGEIARDLVLSEKTVSVHVSNMLHKTGAANRVELAQLARRMGAATAERTR
jgi:DNA-binding CsgD family transcriptional regulator